MVEQSKPVLFGPIQEYNVFQQLARIFTQVGYLLFIKLTDAGWRGELRMPVCPTEIKNDG